MRKRKSAKSKSVVEKDPQSAGSHPTPANEPETGPPSTADLGKPMTVTTPRPPLAEIEAPVATQQSRPQYNRRARAKPLPVDPSATNLDRPQRAKRSRNARSVSPTPKSAESTTDNQNQRPASKRTRSGPSPLATQSRVSSVSLNSKLDVSTNSFQTSGRLSID